MSSTPPLNPTNLMNRFMDVPDSEEALEIQAQENLFAQFQSSTQPQSSNDPLQSPETADELDDLALELADADLNNPTLLPCPVPLRLLARLGILKQSSASSRFSPPRISARLMSNPLSSRTMSLSPIEEPGSKGDFYGFPRTPTQSPLAASTSPLSPLDLNLNSPVQQKISRISEKTLPHGVFRDYPGIAHLPKFKKEAAPQRDLLKRNAQRS